MNAPSSHVFTCNLCDALCGLRVELAGGHVAKVRGNPGDVLSRGHVCPKAVGLGELFDDPDRLRAPMRRTAAGWERVSWDEALDAIGAKLRAVRESHGRDAVALYVGNPAAHSHRASLGALALTAALGTKNRFDPNSQDSNPRLFACMQVFGDGLSLSVPDVERTDHLLVLGANPAVSNGSMLALGDVRVRMQGIRDRGGALVLIDPRRTESAAWATAHHFIRPGGDAALLLSMLHVLFAERLVDAPAVRRIARGLSTLEALAAKFPPARVAPAIGIPAETIRALAVDFARAKTACAYARVGMCQNEFGPLASWLVEVFNVVTGNFDREGGAMFPSPAADIAPLARALVGNQFERWRSRVRGLPEFLGALPSAVMAEEMETPGDGQIRAFVCFAGNPVLSVPNGERVGRALEKLDFMVAVDFFINETSRHADYVLPPNHVFEAGNYDILLSRFTVRNVAKYSAPIVETKDDTRDDWSVLSDLALRVAAPDWAPLRRTLHRWGKTVPERVVDLLLRTGRSKLTLDALRAEPNGVDLGPLVPRRTRMPTPDGRIRLAPPVFVADVPRLERWVDERRESLVLVGRRHLRSNNSWLHNARSLVKGPDRAQLMMHPEDAAELGLVDGAVVRVKSRVGELSAVLSVTSEMMRGVVSLPHGYGHAVVADTLRVAGKLEGPNVNAITDDLLVDPLIGNSILNGVPVQVLP